MFTDFNKNIAIAPAAHTIRCWHL